MSIFGCRICTVEGVHPGSGRGGMYYAECDAPLRTIEDFEESNPVSIVCQSKIRTLITN